jgi:hypothetical protein
MITTIDSVRADDERIVETFLRDPRKIPSKGKNGDVSTLLIRTGPFGPYRAYYSHDMARFFALEYRSRNSDQWRKVILLERQPPSVML